MAFLSRLQNCFSVKSVTATAISIGINAVESQVDIYSSGKPESYLGFFAAVVFLFLIETFGRKYSPQVSFESFQIVRHKKECKNASPKQQFK